MKDLTNHNIEVSGPVENERQKLEMIAKSLGVRVEEKSDEELRKIISSKIGQKKIDKPQNNSKDNTEN